MKLNGWMKALVWLGLGGGIGFFAGYKAGQSRTETDLTSINDRIISAEEALDRMTQEYEEKRRSEMDAMRQQYEEALAAQRRYFGEKDDEIIGEDIMEEAPEMPEDPLGDTDGDEEIQQLHPEDLRPYGITANEYIRNEKGYDKTDLDYYTDDCVIFDPKREEKWTHPEQLLGIGWKERFNSTVNAKPIREIYVCNDTMENLYKITRIDDSFERLYEEE